MSIWKPSNDFLFKISNRDKVADNFIGNTNYSCIRSDLDCVVVLGLGTEKYLLSGVMLVIFIIYPNLLTNLQLTHSCNLTETYEHKKTT